MQWFRFYVEALNDPKVQRLEPNLFRTWVNILCVARENDGDLPKLEDLAFRLRIDKTDAQRAVESLIERGLLDRQPSGGLRPHNWDERQYQSDTSTSRVKRFRQRSMKRLGNGVETVIETHQNRIDTEQIQSREEQNISPFDESLEPISFDEWLDWHAFQLWVGISLDENTGRFPMVVKNALDARCPGFIASEQEHVRECIAKGQSYSFANFSAALLGWGFRVVFQCRPPLMEKIPGTNERTMVYFRDPRYQRMHGYLKHLDRTGYRQKLLAGEVGYPTFEEWRDEAWSHPDDCPVCAGKSYAT
jgi:predicted transcriptional regulator